MQRPSGTSGKDPLAFLLANVEATRRRTIVSQKIRAQTGQPPEAADRTSVHLRWGLQQLRTRGWRNDDWGKLLNDDGTIGDGPVCLLEAMHSPIDAPGALYAETDEQLYLRWAFVVLELQCPVYLSLWNDDQQDFSNVEIIVEKAITLAEADERSGRIPWFRQDLSQQQLFTAFGLTDERARAEEARTIAV